MSGIGGSVEQMTQGHLRNVQQLAVFYTGHNNIYAINIAKVRAFIITEEVAINDTPKDTNIIAGIATVRGEPVTLVNLDAWLGLKPLEIKDYKLIIFCEFNHKKIGFLVKDMLDIVEKTTQELRNTEETNSKINALFGPVFSELTRQLLESIDSSRFMFYTRKTPTQIEEFFSDLDSNVPMDILELDISKYDKSQNEFHCAVEYEIWKRLGLDDFLAEVWKHGHRKTTLKDYTAGIKTCCGIKGKVVMSPHSLETRSLLLHVCPLCYRWRD